MQHNYDWYNAHMHLMGIKNVGKNVIPLLVKFAKGKKSRKVIVKLLRIADPFSTSDDIERLANLIESMGKTQRHKIGEIMDIYEPNTCFFCLTVDHTYLGKGEPEDSFEKQVDEVVELIKEGFPIKMFLHIDPRRPVYFDLILKYEKYISGIKIYNLMGYFPYDIRLTPLYIWCAKNNKPVIFHCSPKNINSYKGCDIDKLLKSSRFPLYGKHSDYNKAANFNNPLGIVEVAKEHPQVPMMISHLCGDDEVKKYLQGLDSWTDIGITACRENKNIFLDSSFVNYNKEAYELISLLLETPIIEDKFCYGDDFDVNKSVAFQNNYYPGLKNHLTPEKWIKHAKTNVDNLLNFKLI